MLEIEESKYIPFQTTTLLNRKVLVLAPHPDDESLGCGGSLILHHQNQDPVKVVFLTDGAKGDFAGEYQKEEYILLREQEARNACKILGISDVEFWKIPDRECQEDEETVERLSNLIGKYRPTLIYAPSPLEFHPDHRATANILWTALQKTLVDTDIAFYEINTPIRINTLVDISSVVEQKKEACDCYNSQQKNLSYTEFSQSLNRFRALTVSPECVYAEGYFLLDSRRVSGSTIETFILEQFANIPKQEDKPLVSIIVRTRNRIPFLKQALASIISQTYKNIEVVVVNDSGEDVSEVVNEFKNYINIRHNSSEQAKGRTIAANTGLKMAQGKYINFLDDDDIFYPQHVEKLVSYLEKTGKQFAYSDCEMGHYQWTGKDYSLIKAKYLYKGIDFDRDRLYRGNYIPIMTAMFTKKLWKQVGSFDESLDVFEDWDFWIRMSQYADFQRLPGVTAEYRVFANPQYDYLHWKLKIYEKHRQFCTRENLVSWLHALEGKSETLENAEQDLRKELAQRQEEIEALKKLNLNFEKELAEIKKKSKRF